MNRNCFFLSFLLLLLSVVGLHAQTNAEKVTYKGKVVSRENGAALEDVICQVINSKGKIVAYSLSNKEGEFTLRVAESKENKIIFKLLGYKTKQLSQSNLRSTQPNIIELQVSTEQLKEVVVTVPPISRSNDTIIYDVNSFKSEQDKYIVDVIKKLPGVKVAENGTISYMGESINKFYIEGRDLMGGQYGIATNNLDVNAVRSVEVIENNQHIKALHKVESSNKAAINLKLKEGAKVRPIGEVQLGVGGTPLLYNNKLFGAYFSEKLQLMINSKMANNGENLLSELEDKLDIYNIVVMEVPLDEMISASTIMGSMLPIKRRLFNKTHIHSINSLVPMQEDSELKFNLSYGEDRINQDFSSLQTIYTSQGNIDINEKFVSYNKLKKLKGSAIYELNSTKGYLKNEVTYTKDREYHNAELFDKGDYSTLSTDEYQQIQNTLQGVVKSKSGKVYNINSLIRYSQRNEYLDKDLLGEKRINQFTEGFMSKSFVTNNNIRTKF